MAFSIAGNTKSAEELKQKAKYEKKVQEYLNRFHLKSRELDTSEVKPVPQEWQGYTWIQEATATVDERTMRYREYREMCKVPELNLGVNIYADNATQINVDKNVLTIESDNNKIIEILEKLFFDTLDVNSNLWRYTRNMIKLGDEFLEVIVDDPAAPKHVASLERFKRPERLKRVEQKGVLEKFVYTGEERQNNSKAQDETFQPWKIVHFRIDEEEFEPYGKSILEAGRRIWKKLTLMEDAMLIYRISRAPERRVFYIDVGTLSTKNANNYIEQVKRKFKKKQYINPRCLSLDTIIPLLDGRSVSLRNLIEEQAAGKTNWVYSVDLKNGNRIVPGKVIWAGETRQSADTLKLTLDDGQWFIVTPDHKMILRNGEYCEAQSLKVGDSLMPLYRKATKLGYEMVVDPSDNRYKFTHMMSDHLHAAQIEEVSKLGQIVRHHKDFNKRNNVPVNIEIMEKQAQATVNHKIVSIEKWTPTDTGTLTVETYHNFAIGDGIFVKNSGEIDEQANVMCITLDTRIPLLDGRALPLSEMIAEHQAGKENWVYSIDTEGSRAVPGRVSWAGVTRKDAELVEVELDNGAKIRCTPDHKFMLRDGSYQEAQSLATGQALMPFETKLSLERDGMKIKDYPMVYDPHSQTYKFVHRLVANAVLREKREVVRKETDWSVNHNRVVHHKDFNKNNASPANLEWIGNLDHIERHKQQGREKLLEYHRSGKSSIDTTRNNLARNSVAAMQGYNGSELHKQHNEIRRANMIRQFSDPELRKKYIDGMTVCDKFTVTLWNKLDEIASSTSTNAQGYVSIKCVVNNVAGDAKAMAEWNAISKPKQRDKFNKKILERALRIRGLESNQAWLESLGLPTKDNRAAYKNHKVVAVRRLPDTEDTGCITVERWHNFSIEQGIYIKNSLVEDFYIPVRQNSQGTRIETLPPGMNLGEIDDVKYFRDAILKTMGIPTGYMGQEQSTYDPKAYLSSQEIQFSRTMERVQRFMVKGLEKIAIIELALQRVEPKELKNFKIKLTPPSNTDQLMEIEVRTQQFALIQSIKSIGGEGAPFLADDWIYKNVLGFTDHEINKAKLQIQMQMQMQLQMQQIYGTPGEQGGGAGGAALGGNIAPTGAEQPGGAAAGEAGGPAPGAGAEAGAEAGAGAGGPAAGEAGLQVAGKELVKFDGGQFLMETTEDMVKLVKYVKMYEEKQSLEKKSVVANGTAQLLVGGELRGMVKSTRDSKVEYYTESEFKAENIRRARSGSA